MKRRDFISLLGGAAGWPLAARAQQAERMRRVGILMPYPPTDLEFQERVRAFRDELARLGWTRDRNIQFDERWTTDNMDLVRANAVNLLELKPDAVIGTGGRVIPVLMQLTRSVPIILPGVSDPVATGVAQSLARPGGNVTGFTSFEHSIFGKWLEMLKQIAPATARVATIFNPDNPNTALYRRLFEADARTLAVQAIIAPIHGIDDIDRVLETLSQQPNGAVLFAPDLTTNQLRDQLIPIVARHRLPAIYADSVMVKSGGLISYAADRTEIFRRTASYVDRVLRGEKPGDLPFQQPTKYELTINLKTARALGVEIPPMLLASADDVIE